MEKTLIIMKKGAVLILLLALTFCLVQAKARFIDLGKKSPEDYVCVPVVKNNRPGLESGDLVLHDNRLDRLVLGRPVKDIFGLYASNRIQKVLIYDARRSYQKIEILNKERTEVLFSIDPDCSPNDSACVIRRINVKSNTYHTAGNLRVGKYYVDIMHSANKVSKVMWYEGNLIVRTKQSELSFILQTSTIPKPWYDTMDKETVPDSTRIIGIMISGKNLDGVSFQIADSLQKKHQTVLAIAKKAHLSKKKSKSIAAASASKEGIMLSTASVSPVAKPGVIQSESSKPVDTFSKGNGQPVARPSQAGTKGEEKSLKETTEGAVPTGPEIDKTSEPAQEKKVKVDMTDLK